MEQEKSTLDAASMLLRLQSYDQLVDFDNHLDCPSRDWTNPEVNGAIGQALNTEVEVESSEEQEEDEEEEEEDDN